MIGYKTHSVNLSQKTTAIGHCFACLMCIVLLGGHATGFAPVREERLDSVLLSKLNFSIKFKLETGEKGRLWIAEVLFDKALSSTIVERVSVIISDEWGNIICQNDHSLADFVTYTSPEFNKGKMERNFGFRFYVAEKFIASTKLKLRLNNGTYIVHVSEFAPKEVIEAPSHAAPNNAP